MHTEIKSYVSELASSLYKIQNELGTKQLREILTAMVEAIPITFLKDEQGKDIGGGVWIENPDFQTWQDEQTKQKEKEAMILLEKTKHEEMETQRRKTELEFADAFEKIKIKTEKDLNEKRMEVHAKREMEQKNIDEKQKQKDLEQENLEKFRIERAKLQKEYENQMETVLASVALIEKETDSEKERVSKEQEMEFNESKEQVLLF